MNVTINADTISKFMSALLAGAGAAQYFDLVNFLTMVSPENAAGIVSLWAIVKLILNAWTKATTVTVPAADVTK